MIALSGRGKSVFRTGHVFRVRAELFPDSCPSLTLRTDRMRPVLRLLFLLCPFSFLCALGLHGKPAVFRYRKGPEAEAEYSEILRIRLQNGLQTPSHSVMTPIPEEDEEDDSGGASPAWRNAFHPPQSPFRHCVTGHAGTLLESSSHDIGQTWQLRQLLLSAREVTATKVVSE